MTIRHDASHKLNSPKYLVVAVGPAKIEGRKILTPVQYAHMVAIEKRLEDWGNRDELADLDIEKVTNQIWELKEKGGPLHKKNIRVYFSVLEESREVVVLKTYKKEQDGQVSRHVLISAEDRLDDYEAGLLNAGKSVHIPTAVPKNAR